MGLLVKLLSIITSDAIIQIQLNVMDYFLQVELLVTYEGQRFVVNDLKLLMDQFHRTEFTGTWRRLFSRVKKHIIWGVLKSVTGMQVMNDSQFTFSFHFVVNSYIQTCSFLLISAVFTYHCKFMWML